MSLGAGDNVQETLSGFRYDPRGLPHGERHAKGCPWIPCRPQLRDDDVAGVIAAVNAFESPTI
jgi:dTDP-4-amino-4,6-dideoxygalactose transaminase